MGTHLGCSRLTVMSMLLGIGYILYVRFLVLVSVTESGSGSDLKDPVTRRRNVGGSFSLSAMPQFGCAGSMCMCMCTMQFRCKWGPARESWTTYEAVQALR